MPKFNLKENFLKDGGSMKLFNLAVLVSVSIILLVAGTVNKSTDNDMSRYKVNESQMGTDSVYKIKLKMNQEKKFKVTAQIDIKNTSNSSWENLKLYFIPNVFTKENSPSLEKPSEVKITALHINNIPSTYTLKKDTLEIPLNSKVKVKENIQVNIDYEFTLPHEGLRFTQNGKDLHLAQWYPMVPTYNKGWNKEDYKFRGESYHTFFSDFELEMDVPTKYTVVTSSDRDNALADGEKVTLKEVNEVFIALLDNPSIQSKRVNDINVKVFSNEQYKDFENEILEIATQSIKYFDENIGNYASNELDIIVGGLGMEYPNAITVGNIYDTEVLDLESLKRMVVHEIAHQWFYGMINNDPFHEAWLDEGMTELAKKLFYSDYKNEEFSFENQKKFSETLPLPVNLSLDQYKDIEMSSYVYGKSTTSLGLLMQKYGGKETAKDFLKKYFNYYKFKHINTEEFVRFTKFYFELDNNDEFTSWLDLK
jgi:hypothetical protein